MSSPYEAALTRVMQTWVTQSQDPLIAQKPFYGYGREEYNNYNGNPPQIRFNLQGWTFTQPKQRATTGNAPVGTMQSEFATRIWAHDEEELHAMFSSFQAAIRGTQFTDGERADQYDSETEISGLDEDDHHKGIACEFVTTLPVIAQKQSITLTTLSSSLYSISGSFTGSLDLTQYPAGQPQSEWNVFLSGSTQTI
jgi:hypothetical protein